MGDTAALPCATTGDVLGGRYRLLELIGEGGMARVYRAEDALLGRVVAVKLLRSTADGDVGTERGRAETRLLASLSYHSLVTLFDAHISQSGQSYLVMEYIEGRTLRDRIVEGTLSPQETAYLAVDLAEALHVVHSAGVVHRDLKPSNVLLSPSPIPGREFRAKLADFGIAFLLDDTRITAAGSVVGTAAYLAPEQVRGAAPGTAVDIYGLGLVLLEALTGRRAFAPAEGVESVVARLSVSPEIPADLPAAWQGLLRGMTAREPEDRPCALEVARAASALLADGFAAASRDASLDDTQPVAIRTPMTAAASEPPVDPTTKTAAMALPRRLRRNPSRRGRRIALGAAGAAAAALIAVSAPFFAFAPVEAKDTPSQQSVTEPVADDPAAPDVADAAIVDAPAVEVPVADVVEPVPAPPPAPAEPVSAPVVVVPEGNSSPPAGNGASAKDKEVGASGNAQGRAAAKSDAGGAGNRGGKGAP